MALPFVAGLAVGSLAVVAFNNKDKIKEKLSQGCKKGKEVAQNLKECAEDKLKSDECCECVDEKADGCECECHDKEQVDSKNTQTKKDEADENIVTVEPKKPSTRTKKTANKGE